MKKRLFILVLLAAFVPSIAGLAQDGIKPAFHTTGYPLPRFVSLGAQKIYVRAGPGSQYPIKWVYEKNGLPVEIVLEFETWRKIRDIDGQEGWVHQSLLSGKRTVLIKNSANVPVRAKPDPNARVVAYMEPHVMGALKKCQPSWCEVSSGGYEGWINREFIYGVYPDENPD